MSPLKEIHDSVQKSLPSSKFGNYIKDRAKLIKSKELMSSETHKLRSEDMCYSDSENSQFRLTAGTNDSPFRRTSDF